MMKVVLALSGGLDSSVLLAYCLSVYKSDQPICITFGYRSLHNYWERAASRRIAKHYDIPFHVEVDTTECFTATKSALISQCKIPIPKGKGYNDPIQKQTVVPGRNLIFTSILAGIAQSQFQEGEIWMGMHKGDATIYPDCRPAWVTAVRAVIHQQSEGRIILQAPFIDHTKADIVKIGLGLSVPFELTRTCYTSQQTACGQCGACLERQEAFKLNNAVDPIGYEHPVL